MRLDSKFGDKGWKIYHARRCMFLNAVVWVDDGLPGWAQYALPFQPSPQNPSEPLVTEFAASRIDIFTAKKLVVIDPVLGIEYSEALQDEDVALLLRPPLFPEEERRNEAYVRSVRRVSAAK